LPLILNTHYLFKLSVLLQDFCAVQKTCGFSSFLAVREFQNFAAFAGTVSPYCKAAAKSKGTVNLSCTFLNCPFVSIFAFNSDFLSIRPVYCSAGCG
ncbi:hypothetical protein, partial [uncultured Parasutterella sp.]